MPRRSLLALLLLTLASFAGCDRDPMSERGFRLPDGDAMASMASSRSRIARRSKPRRNVEMAGPVALPGPCTDSNRS